MTDPRNVIPAGPGHIDCKDWAYAKAADVELELEYLPGAEGDTVATLHLTATKIEEGIADQVIGVELTATDLRELIGWAQAMIEATTEDT